MHYKSPRWWPSGTALFESYFRRVRPDLFRADTTLQEIVRGLKNLPPNDQHHVVAEDVEFINEWSREQQHGEVQGKPRTEMGDEAVRGLGGL